MRPVIFRCLLTLLSGCVGAALGTTMARAEPPPPVNAAPEFDGYLLRAWDMQDGLPSNHVSGLTQTPDGCLWLVTPKGLARFDGFAFTPATPSGVEAGTVTRIFSASDGALWVKTAPGVVARGDGHRFEPILTGGAETSPMEIPPFSEDREGGIWFRRANGVQIFHWLRGSLSPAVPDHPPERETTLGNAPTLVQFLRADHASTDGKPEAGSLRLAPSGDGSLWAARGDQLRRWRGDGTGEPAGDLSWLGGAVEISRLYESRAGDLWIGTRRNGLFRLRDGKFVHVRTSHAAISALGEDRAGNLWVGTQGGGLNRLQPRGFSLLQFSDGLPDSQIASLALDETGRLWVGGGGDPPVRATDTANRAFATVPGWPGRLVYALAADPSRGIWAAGSAGLACWDGGAFHHLTEGGALTALLPDRRGGVWTAPVQGPLLHHRDGKNQAMPAEGGLVDPRALAEDGQGRVWVGTEAGLVFRQDGERFVQVPLPGARAGDPIRFIVPDGETVWIGAARGGLHRWRDGRITRLGPGENLPNDELRALAVGPNGDLWVGTERGLFRLAKEAVQAAVNGQSVPQPVYFGSGDGLPTTDFSMGFRNATARTSDGNLYFSTLRGVLRINLPNFQPTALGPVQIEKFCVGDTEADGVQPVVPPRAGPVRLRYTLPDLNDADRLSFRHRLVGLGDGQWIFADGQRTATFPYLRPGEYRFEVQASRGDGCWLPDPTVLRFTVRAAWWETAAFKAAGVGVIFLLLGWLVRWAVLRRLQARVRRLEQENAFERERARIARDMHDDIGASLTGLAFLSDAAAREPHLPPESARRIREIAGKARSVAGTLDRIVWTVNPRNDTLDRLLGYVGEYAAEYLQRTGLQVRVNIPAQVPPTVVPSNVRHEILLACKEALNNIVKHAGARKAAVSFSLGEDGLHIVLADDGCGFEPGLVAASANGLGNMRQRIEALGGSAEIRTKTGDGTTVIFVVPLRVDGDRVPR